MEAKPSSPTVIIPSRQLHDGFTTRQILFLLVKEVHTVLLHDTQEPDHDPGRRTDENLTLAATLSVHNAHEGIVLHMLLAPYHV